jgi:hypothetical protein
MGDDFLPRPNVMPYFIFYCLGNHQDFLGYLVSSQHLGSDEILSEVEDEILSIHAIPLKIWIDRACGHPSRIYLFKQDLWDDQTCGYSFQQDFLPPTHLHEFHYMIDYMSIYAHDYYILNLYLLYYVVKHRGRYLDEMMNGWLHPLYDFT